MSSVSTKSPMGGDFLIHPESMQYNLLSLPVEATAEANVAQVAGTPVQIDAGKTKATLVTKAGVASANGFLVQGPKLTNFATGTTVEKYAVLWAGPAVINNDKYNLTEAYGAADFTQAELDTQAAAMPGDIKIVSEPVAIKVQDANPEDRS